MSFIRWLQSEKFDMEVHNCKSVYERMFLRKEAIKDHCDFSWQNFSFRALTITMNVLFPHGLMSWVHLFLAGPDWSFFFSSWHKRCNLFYFSFSLFPRNSPRPKGGKSVILSRGEGGLDLIPSWRKRSKTYIKGVGVSNEKCYICLVSSIFLRFFSLMWPTDSNEPALYSRKREMKQQHCFPFPHSFSIVIWGCFVLDRRLKEKIKSWSNARALKGHSLCVH